MSTTNWIIGKEMVQVLLESDGDHFSRPTDSTKYNKILCVLTYMKRISALSIAIPPQGGLSVRKQASSPVYVEKNYD